MSHDDPAEDFLRRLDAGEIDDRFQDELTRLSLIHRAIVCDMLVERSEAMQRRNQGKKALSENRLVSKHARTRSVSPVEANPA